MIYLFFIPKDLVSYHRYLGNDLSSSFFLSRGGGALLRRGGPGSLELLGRAGKGGAPDIGKAYGEPLFSPGLFLFREVVGAAVACIMSL